MEQEVDITQTKGFKLAQDMGDFVNTYRHNSEEFIEGFCRQHRTLQQSSFRLILDLIEHMASDKYHTDLRNEASKKAAQDLRKGFFNQYFNELRAGGASESAISEEARSFTYKMSQFLPFI